MALSIRPSFQNRLGGTGVGALTCAPRAFQMPIGPRSFCASKLGLTPASALRHRCVSSCLVRNAPSLCLGHRFKHSPPRPRKRRGGGTPAHKPQAPQPSPARGWRGSAVGRPPTDAMLQRYACRVNRESLCEPCSRCRCCRAARQT